MKKIHWIYLSIAVVIILIVWFLTRKPKVKEETKIVVIDGKPTVVKVNPTNVGPPLITMKTDPREFVLQDQIYAGQDLVLYKSKSVGTTNTGDLYKKDEFIGRFVSVDQQGWITVASIKSGSPQYISSNKIVYVK